MSKQQLWSLVILVVMVGSLFAAITYDSQGGSQQNPNVPVPPVQQNTTRVSYTAKQVPVKVLQVFPTAILVGTTTEFNVANVDAELRKLPGIFGVSGSEFFEPPDKTANFRTSVKFSSSEKMPEALRAIADANILSGYNLFPSALVSIPENIEFRNDDADLNYTYKPQNRQAQVIVTMDTRKGDSLEVTLNADFQGQRLAAMSGLIERNLDSAPKFSAVNNAFTISSLEDVFSLEGKSSKLDAPALGIVKGFFSGGTDYNSSLEVKDKTEETKLFFTEPEKVFEQDLNAFLTGYAGVDFFEIRLDQNLVAIKVAEAQDYKAFVQVLSEELGKLGFNVKSVEDPETGISGLVTVLNGGREKFLADLAEKEKEIGIKFTVFQKARFDTNSIFIEDQNAHYALSSGYFNALVNPVHSAGDDVNLSVVLTGNSRVGVMQILDSHEEGTEGSPLPLLGE